MHKDKILWCLYCERTYKKSQSRVVPDDLSDDPFYMCAYADCDGDAVIDAWDYEKTKSRCSRVSWPQIPIPGVVYPLCD